MTCSNTGIRTAVAQRSMTLARNYYSAKNFGRAFSHFLVALHLRSDWTPVLEDEFSRVLCEWGLRLEEKHRVSELFKCYEQAIKIFPKSVVILNNLGSHLLRCNFLKEAEHYFNQCLRLSPNFLRAQHNLDNLASLAVERWHFRMLNDKRRNLCFRNAIKKKTSRGCTRVLDIGTGTGLLSLFCLEGGATEIYACDSSEIMIDLSRKVLERNHVSRINLLHKHSTQIQIPDDIPHRVSLVVTETFDSGLLGEGILETMSHAWENLLLPSGLTIPCGARIHVTGVECDSLAQRFYPNANDFGLVSNEVQVLSGYNGDYDSSDLTLVHHRLLTSTEIASEINFNDPKSIAEALNGDSDGSLCLRCRHAGRLDCFAVWFDLMLDEDIVLSTGPDAEENEAWQQAIFPLGRSAFVRENENIHIRVSLKSGKLSIALEESNLPANPPLAPSMALTRTLNDVVLAKILREQAEEMALSTPPDRPVRIMDWFPFPLFGLIFLRTKRYVYGDSLTCLVASEEDRSFIGSIVKNHGLESRVTIDLESHIDEYSSLSGTFDVVVLNFVETTGEIKGNCVTKLPLIRSLLKPNGAVLPADVTLVGQFIHSDWLLKSSRVVNDDVTCSYDVGEFINSYQVRHFIDIDSGVGKTIISDPINLFSITDSGIATSATIPGNFDSFRTCAFLYWFKIRLTEDSEEMSTSDLNCAFNQSAFVFSDEELARSIQSGQLRCRFHCDDGLFSVELLSDIDS